MAKINERIKEQRLASGKTLLEVAEFLGVKEATAQRYESGEIKNIKHETIVLYGELFKTSPSYIMGWTDSPIAATSTVPTPTELTPDEAELLADYRLLNATGGGEAGKRVHELTLIAAYTERERKKETA